MCDWVFDVVVGMWCLMFVLYVCEDELMSLCLVDFLLENMFDVCGIVLENSYYMICVDNDCDDVVWYVFEFFGFDFVYVVSLVMVCRMGWLEF